MNTLLDSVVEEAMRKEFAYRSMCALGYLLRWWSYEEARLRVAAYAAHHLEIH